MDPISLVIAALAAGATAALKDTASTAVTDAYAGLKGLIRRRFKADDDALMLLERAEAQPEGKHASLAERLRATAAESDQELVDAARAVLIEADPAGFQAGRYDVRISGGKGIVVGDHAAVTMNFDDRD
jgi:hypothetical protein